MVQCAGRPRFELEPSPSVSIRGCARENLDRHLARQLGPRVACPVDLAHTAGADGREDFIDAETRAG